MDAFRFASAWPARRVAISVRHKDEHHWMGPVDERFPLASLTKLITALAALVAFEEGLFDLDEPQGPRNETLRELLSHASGLGSDEPRRRLAEPRTRRIYSNAGYELVAELIETASGIRSMDYLAEAVIEPLGMRDSSIDGSAAHGASSTVLDLEKLADALCRPVLLAETTLAAMTSPQFPDLGGVLPGFGRQEPNPWGLGPEIRGTKAPHWTGGEASASTYGHFGRSGTFLWIDPTRDVAVIALTDRDFGDWALTAWPQFNDAVVDEVDNHG